MEKLIIIAILVEAIWENLKMTYKKGKFNINMIGSLLLGMLICIVTKLNIFEIVGIEISIELVGYILTGIIVSRGANFVNDIFDRIKGEGNLFDTLVNVGEKGENNEGN